MPRRRRNKASMPLREINQQSGIPREKTLKSSKSAKNLESPAHNTKVTDSTKQSGGDCLPTCSLDQTNTPSGNLRTELDSFRQEWRRELETTKPRDIAENADCVKSILDTEDDRLQNCKTVDHTNSTTAELYNEVDSFRQRWKREGAKSQNSSPSDTYAEARKLFLIAVELEQDDLHHESIRFYKMAMHLCPDIEKQIFQEQCEASASAPSNKNFLPNQKDKIICKVEQVDGEREEVQLYGRIQRNFNEDMKDEQRHIHCRPKNKLKPGSLHISDLPHELILQILRYVIGEELDLASLELLGLVCRGFYLLSNDSSLWRSICYHTWTEDTIVCDNQKRWSNNDKEDFVNIDWKQMFLDRPRVNYDGVYISRTRYIRQGDVGFQDVTYRPFHVIRYYRYLRFFPDKRVLILTTNEEPDKIIPIFRHALHSKQFSPELSILEGVFELSKSNQVSIVAERDCRSAQNSSQNYRRRAQLDWYRQTPISQKFNLRFELKTVKSKPFKNNVLKWLDYTMLTRLETGQEITTFDLSPDTFPDMIFSRVKKFNLGLTKPLSSH